MVQNFLWVYGMGMAWMSVRFPGLKFCPSPPLSATLLLLQMSKYQDLLLSVHPQTCWCEQEILLWYKHTLYHPIIDLYRWNRGSVSEALQLLQQALANGEQQAHWLLIRKEPNQLHHVNNYVYNFVNLGLRHPEFHELCISWISCVRSMKVTLTRAK